MERRGAVELEGAGQRAGLRPGGEVARDVVVVQRAAAAGGGLEHFQQALEAVFAQHALGFVEAEEVHVGAGRLLRRVVRQGTGEEAIRYGWNYAKLLAEGPSEGALVTTPLMKGMKDGKLVRIEELTRISADVQDTLITVLSEKTMPIPELNMEIQAVRGFNVIATANNRDRAKHVS